MWSIGVILYILLCGFPPFNGSTNEEIMEKVKIGKYSFKHEVFENVSDEAKDLIKKMLTKNPVKRLSCEEALQHEWFKVSLEDKPISPKLMENLTKFRSENKM